MLYISESDWANSFLGCKVERKVWLNVDFTILFIFLFCASWLLWSKESRGKTITRKDYYDLNCPLEEFVLYYLCLKYLDLVLGEKYLWHPCLV